MIVDGVGNERWKDKLVSVEKGGGQAGRIGPYDAM